MEDSITPVFLLVLGIFGFAIAILIGRLMDMQFRCWLMRIVLKKNYIVVNFAQKNGHVIFSSVANSDNGVIVHNQKMWVLKGGKIWNEQDITRSYFFKNKDLKFRNGAPNVYLDPDTLQPLDFYKTEDEVKPDEIGSNLLAWVYVELARGLNKVKDLDIYLKAAVALVAICLIAQYFIIDGQGQAAKERAALNGRMDEMNQKLEKIGTAFHIDLTPPPPANATKNQTGGNIVYTGGG